MESDRLTLGFRIVQPNKSHLVDKTEGATAFEANGEVVEESLFALGVNYARL